MSEDELIAFTIKYRMLFDRLISGHHIFESTNDGFVFMDESGHEVNISINNEDKEMMVRTKINDKDYIEYIYLPEAGSSFIRTREIIYEKRPNGCKEDDIVRFYCKNKDDDTFYTSDLYQTTTCSDNFGKEFKSTFECHKHNNKTMYNNRDITYLYKDIKDDLAVEKIYNLYNGKYKNIIDGELIDISSGDLDSECFDFKSYNGIKDREDELIDKMKKMIY